jgi:hypothetical protein
VSAAIISSFVSAGSAVYASINQADRKDQQAVENAVRADREKNYTDFSGSLNDYVGQLGIIRGRLIAHQSVDSVRPSITDFSRGFAELDRAANLHHGW